MSRRVIAIPLPLIPVAAALAACAPVVTEPTLVTDGSNFAIVAGPPAGGMDALLVGTIELDENECWAIRSENDDTLLHVLWPHGTDFLRGETEAGGLDVPGLEHPLNPGDRVEIGGGELTSDAEQVPCWDEGDLIWVMAPED